MSARRRSTTASTYRPSRPLAAVAATLCLALLPLAPALAAPAPTSGPRQRALLTVPAGVDLRGVAEQVAQTGGAVVNSFPVAGALLVSVPAGWVAPALVARVADRPMRVSGASASTGGSTVRDTVGGWSTTGGTGVTVAVVDTGVSDVADLAGRVEHLDITEGPDGDGYGHGTFMAGLVAGSGLSSQGRYAGVAPAGRVLDVRVATATGDTSLSLVLAGLQAVADRRRVDPSLRVLNLSLSEADGVPAMFDPLSRALEQLWADGVTVVVAAGNDGPRMGTVSAPGTDPVVLTVGAIDEAATSDREDDTIADFSARGRVLGGASKPEIAAPGVSLVSVRAPGSVIDVENPGARVGDSSFRGSGTSMAAAVTSGAVAALLSARPELSPDQVKALLTTSAYAVPGKRAGTGGLDLAAALAADAPDLTSDQTGPGALTPAWSDFAAAWQSGDLDAAARAWSLLTPQTQRWASQAFAVSVLTAPDADGTRLAARAWSARAWSARAWSARAWSGEDWLARAWSARAWSDTSWAARAWSARAWSARAWSDAQWADAVWSARAWSARAWSARAWSARAWSARAWSVGSWGG